MALFVRKKDKVVVLSGKDRGKRAEVVNVDIDKERVIVQGVNIVKRHRRATQDKPGGIQTMEAPLHVSKVQLVCPRCDKPTRARAQAGQDGRKERLCRKCGEQIL